MNYHHHHITIINLRPRFPPFFRPGFKSLSPSPCVFLWCCFFHPLVPYLCHQPSCNAVLTSQTTPTPTSLHVHSYLTSHAEMLKCLQLLNLQTLTHMKTFLHLCFLLLHSYFTHCYALLTLKHSYIHLHTLLLSLHRAFI